MIDALSITVSVVVPTYKRPDDLRRCLVALARQTQKADEIFVVIRDTDQGTIEMLDTASSDLKPIRRVIVTQPGQVHALNMGLAQATTDVVAITDDDAAPHPDWIERIAAHFSARPDLGGVGGRDQMYVGQTLQAGREAIVGKVPLIGKHIGNHHLGFGAPREVDVIKGVNGSYRAVALRPIGFDTRLRGTGAQVHWEVSLGIALRRAGWKLLYDPAVLVDHFLAERFDEDQRNTFNRLALKNMSYNETLIRMDQLSTIGAVAFMFWSVLVGTRVTPGLAQWIRFLPREPKIATDKLITTIAGRFDAWRDANRSRSTSVPVG